MVDLSVLSNYYAARTMALGASMRTAAGLSAKSTASLPPWDVRLAQPSPAKRLSEALALPLAIRTDDPAFDQPGVPADHKKLFALYKALHVLSTLASEAANDRTSSGQLLGLDRRFQTGLSTIQDFLSKLTLDSLTVLAGEKTSKVEASVRVPRANSNYLGGVAQRGKFDDPLAGLSGTEVFTIRSTKFGVDTDVIVDLSEVSGGLTLDNIVAHVNQRLEEQGILTRFKRVALEHDEKGIAKNFAIQIVGVSVEKITLTAASAKPAAYVVGVSGNGIGADVQFMKFAGLDGSGPTRVFRHTVDAGDWASLSARATAIDGDGNVYVLGNTNGAVDGQTVKGEQDIVLRKYDSAGNLAWSKLLGASDRADGFGLATTSDGDVVVAGRVRGKLSSAAIGGGYDSFVARFNSEGEEEFVRQLSPLVEDAAASVTVGADGSIYVAGHTKTRLAGVEAHGGGADAFVTKLTAGGALVYNRQFGGAGDERASAMAVADDGNIVVASIEDGIAVVRKFDSADATSHAIWEKTLGAIQGGHISQIAVNGGQIYIAGSTGNAELTASGEGNIAQAHSGGLDGFVMLIEEPNGNTADVKWVSYIGTSALDRVAGVQVIGTDVYVTGETRGALPGQIQSRAGAANGFLVKLSEAGAKTWSQQFAGEGGIGTGTAIVVDAQGSSVLDVLGLPRGSIDQTRSLKLTANSNIRAGESFFIKVNDKVERRIRITADETLRSLANKINSVLLLHGKASVKRASGADVLRIEAKEGTMIQLRGGPEGFDALEGLGLLAGKIVNDGSSSRSSDEDEDEDAAKTSNTKGVPTFGLGLEPHLKLVSKTDAARAREVINGALSEIRKAFREITRDPILDELAERRNRLKGPVPEYLRSQLASYRAGLARLQAGTPTSLYF